MRVIRPLASVSMFNRSGRKSIVTTVPGAITRSDGAPEAFSVLARCDSRQT